MNASQTCSFSSQLSAFHDGELLPDQSRDVEAHVAECESCSAELAVMRRFSRVFHSAQMPAGPGPEYWEDLPSLLSSMPPVHLDESAEDEQASRDRMRMRPRQPTHLKYVKWMSGAAAAVFLVAAGRLVYLNQTGSSGTGHTNGGGTPVLTSQPVDSVKVAPVKRDETPGTR